MKLGTVLSTRALSLWQNRAGMLAAILVVARKRARESVRDR
jgi:hypothetical protein